MRKILLFALFLSLTIGVSAQKFGYLNSQQLMAEMPDIKTADTQLKAFQDPLIEKGQKMLKDLEAEYNKYIEDVNAGLLSNAQRQQKEQEFQTKQQSLQKYEYDIQTQVAQKREELYKPIIDKINAAIKSFGEANGYTMIFDSSAGMLLHAATGDDIYDELKASMGI